MIGRKIAHADQPGNRGQVDDRPAPGGAQMRDGVLCAEEHALDVHGLDTVPIRLADLIGGLGAARDARVVDHYMQPAEPGSGSINRRFHRRFIGDVHAPEGHCMAPCGKVGRQGLALGLQHIEDRDLGSFLRHALDASLADADSASGHDGGLSGQSVHGNLL